MTKIEGKINSAINLLKTDNFVETEKALNEVLKEEPENPLALFLMSELYIKKNDLKKAIRYLELTTNFAPDKPNTKIKLANLYLKEKNFSKCIDTLNEVEKISDNIVSFYHLKGNYYKSIGKIELSLNNYNKALELLRSSKYWPKKKHNKSIVDPTLNSTFRYSSKSKIIHDFEQLEYLKESGIIFLEKEMQNLRKVLDEWPKNISDDKMIYLEECIFKYIHEFYNRVIYISQNHPEVIKPLNLNLNYNKIDNDYIESDFPIIVIDNLLSKEALNIIWNYCLESTIWFDCKENGGYLGSYMTDGFDHPILIDLAKDLKNKLPKTFKKKFLNQMWALKYKSTGKGTRLHADDALLNLNLWITPDSSKNSIDEDSGMVIYKKSVPEEWNFEDYNQSDTKIENYIKLSDPQKVTIPYKENRAVIFDSKFIHKSQDINFKNGYKNKRINITMLFDLIYS